MTPLRVLRGRQPARRPPATDDLTRLRSKWLATFQALGVCVSRPPFATRDPHRIIWLPKSDQAVFIAEVISADVRRCANALDHLIGDRGHVDPLELTEDLRVVIGLPSGRFFGFRGGALAVHADSVDLNRCVHCRHWWFCLQWGGWECRCCGRYDGNSHIVEQFSNSIRLAS